MAVIEDRPIYIETTVGLTFKLYKNGWLKLVDAKGIEVFAEVLSVNGERRLRALLREKGLA